MIEQLALAGLGDHRAADLPAAATKVDPEEVAVGGENLVLKTPYFRHYRALQVDRAAGEETGVVVPTREGIDGGD